MLFSFIILFANKIETNFVIIIEKENNNNSLGHL